MEGYITLIIVILYAERSLCGLTRNISRIIFYTHVMAVLAPWYALDQTQGLVCGFIAYVLGFLLCADLSDTKSGKILFIGLIILVSCLYLPILLGIELELILFGWDIVGSSAEVFRWGVLLSLSSCSAAVGRIPEYQKRDFRLAILSVVLLMLFG